MNQEDGTTQESIKQALTNTAVTAVDNTAVTVRINTINYTPAVKGSLENPAGTHGTFKFSVTVAKGFDEDTTEQKTINIIAQTLPVDVLAVNTAKIAAETANYSNMTQASATSDAIIMEALKAMAIAAINNPTLSVSVSKVASTAPVAGTFDYPLGADGSFTFAVHVSKNTVLQKTKNMTITITATPETGVHPDLVAVNAAKNAAEAATYANMAQASVTNEETIVLAIRSTISAAIKDSSVNATINKISYLPAVIGSGTNHGESDGLYVFTVTFQKGAKLATTKQLFVVINARMYIESPAAINPPPLLSQYCLHDQ